ncbi:MAG: hypothetical protein A2107_01240 [Verrucomicrobia bacterium GWF2_62_7]|nr:MAG: hypothetical protein A2107_01240 [Verrucomicrobia bacterium GWF2_62_7]
MPAKKKVEIAPAPAAETKPAAKRAVKKAAAPKAAAAKPPAPKRTTAAATHKAPATRAAKKSAAPAFDIDLHRAEVEHEAYLLWVNRGHEHGQEHEDWLSAIEIVKTRHQA